VNKALVTMGAQKPRRSLAPAPARTAWCWQGWPRLLNRRSMLLQKEFAHSGPSAGLSSSSGYISQMQFKLCYRDGFYPNSMTKSRVKKPGPFLLLTSCWTFGKSLCLTAS